MKQKTRKPKKNISPDTTVWEHLIFKVFEGEMEPGNGFFDLNSDRTQHVFMEDLEEVFDEMHYMNWHFNFGFAVDKKTFYLMYKKIRPPRDRNKP